MIGTFFTNITTELELKLPGLNHNAKINANCHFKKKSLIYDLIQGRDILHELRN